MIYKFDDTPITDFGAIPSPANGQFAITGILDMPKRIGTTEHNWGTSIEPFVDAEDIQLDGRTINLQVAIKKDQLQYFLDACIDCKELEVFDDTIEGRNYFPSAYLRDRMNYSFAGSYNTTNEPISLKPNTRYRFSMNGTPDMQEYWYVFNLLHNNSRAESLFSINRRYTSNTSGAVVGFITKETGLLGFTLYLNGISNSDLPLTPPDFFYEPWIVEGNITPDFWTPAPEDIFFPHPVLCRDEIKVREVNDYCIVNVPFWQDEVIYNPVTIRPSNTGEIRIDGYDLAKDFDVYVAQSNDLDSVAKRIEVQTTEIYKRTNFRASRTIDIACTMKAVNTTDLFYKMNEFQAMLMMPGVREFKIRNKDYFVYFKDGMSVDIVAKNIARFNLKATVV